MRKYNFAMWCCRKHFMLSKVHILETLQKLYRECKEGKCKLSKPTRVELEEAVANLAAAEEHIGEILAQKEIPELRRLMDEVRRLRQELTQTNIPFRVELDVKPESMKVLERALKKLDEFLERIDKYATEMEQELSDVECPRCEEDVSFLEQMKDNLESLGQEFASLFQSGEQTPLVLRFTSKEEIEEEVKRLTECFDVPPPKLNVSESPVCEAYYTTGVHELTITTGCEEKHLYHEFFHHLADLKGEARDDMMHELEAEVFSKIMREYPICGEGKRINKGTKLNYTRLSDMNWSGIKDVYIPVIAGKLAKYVWDWVEGQTGVSSTYIKAAFGIGVPVLSALGKIPANWDFPLVAFAAVQAADLIDEFVIPKLGIGVSYAPPAVSVPPVAQAAPEVVYRRKVTSFL